MVARAEPPIPVQGRGALVGKGFRIPGSKSRAVVHREVARGRGGRRGHSGSQSPAEAPSPLASKHQQLLPPLGPSVPLNHLHPAGLVPVGRERSRRQREGPGPRRGVLGMVRKGAGGCPWALAANVTGKWLPLPVLGTGEEPLAVPGAGGHSRPPNRPGWREPGATPHSEPGSWKLCTEAQPC